ncbi:hypothetical protein KC367_g8920 [Hortaea werneckii]|nr:hypothetical protein KC342_g11035 [Hortaea werneckii]KAI7108370.1 hypothetical protein KC339_g1642 [Hortaea werneckii]KAI7210268.1 hypothetical protein KC365_g15365 [Hortaea werneckii]KAI7299117.1 hypothetical protein KC340_g13972 [Hortaea werneckii]KAI7383645.1 hypothetical protein KC328_g11178 [Hortaea werneckii]
MVDFGYSVGDVVYAIKILYVIIQAFDENKGAKKKYALSSGFLRQLVPVLDRLKDQIQKASSEERRQQLLVNSQTINDAYGVFDDYIRNKYSALSADEPSKLKQILKTMKWSLDELHDKVQKLKSDVTAAMQPFMALMLQDIYISVEDMAEDFRKASSSSEESSKRIQQITTMLEQIQEQDQILHTAALDYQCGLAEEERSHRSREHAEVQRSLSEIQEKQRSQATRSDLEAAIQANREAMSSQIEGMLESHDQLIRSRDELLLTMQRQQTLALDKIEAAEWERLQDQAQRQAEKQAEKQATEQKQVREIIEADLKDATKIATNFTDLTGNDTARQGLERFSKIGGILGRIGRMAERRAGSGSDGAATTAGQITCRRSPSPRPTTGRILNTGNAFVAYLGSSSFNSRPNPFGAPSSRIATETPIRHLAQDGGKSNPPNSIRSSRSHSIGYAVVSTCPNIPPTSQQIPYYHHRRLNFSCSEDHDDNRS